MNITITELYDGMKLTEAKVFNEPTDTIGFYRQPPDISSPNNVTCFMCINGLIVYKFILSERSYMFATDKQVVIWDPNIDSSPEQFLHIMKDIIEEQI